MKQRICVNCPTGQVLDQSQKVCVTLLPNVTNPAWVNATTGPKPATTANDIPCPTSTPFYNGQACISCPEMFDYSSKTCTPCPDGTYFDTKSKSCAQNKPNITNVAAANIIGNITTGPNDIPCPVATPYFNGSNCITCKDPTPLFDASLGQCSSCLTGTVYNATVKACIQPGANATNVNAIKDYIGPKPVQSQYDVPCPASTPYYDGSNCISCTNPTPLFDTTTAKCSLCPSGTVYNSSTHKCDKLPTATNPQAASSQKYIGTVPTPKSTDVLCTTNAPFYDGQKCVSCSDPTPIFDFSILRCSSCPSNTVYNSNTHSCDRLPNLSNNGATNYVGTIPVPTANDVPCDIKTPFFDGTKCISCQDPTPLFDTVNRVCFTCPSKTRFDAASN